jgi:hypothetical protein
MKKKLKKDIFMRTLQVMETKVKVQNDPLTEEDFIKIGNIQKQAEEVEIDQLKSKRQVIFKKIIHFQTQ